MGKIIELGGQRPEGEEIKLKTPQWIMQLEMDLSTDVTSITQDLGTVPPKNMQQKKVSEDNNLTTLFNAIAQMVGHLMKSGVSYEYCINKVTEAVGKGIMPAEDAWKIKGGFWKLYLINQPATGKISINRSTNNIIELGNNGEKDAVNKDFYLICKCTHVFIQHLICASLSVEKLLEALTDSIAVYLASGTHNSQHRPKIQMSINSAEENMKLEPLLIEATRFVKTLLPDFYACSKQQNGIHCVSSSDTGIQPDSDDAEWKFITGAITEKFGQRFIGVHHKTNTNHLDFTLNFK